MKDVTQGLSSGTTIRHAPLLVAYAEAVVSRDDAATKLAREAVLTTMGNDALVDAAATISAFHGFVRIADAIGIPYKTAAMGGDAPELREEVGINRFPRVTAD